MKLSQETIDDIIDIVKERVPTFNDDRESIKKALKKLNVKTDDK